MSIFLKRLTMQGFGAFLQKRIGPFKPGMNVVYGQNEAGKTTITKFIEGVLFGWESAHGNRNTYRPQNVERSGFFVLCDSETGAEYELSRQKNAEGLLGNEDALTLVADIDKDTFATMFLLTSDELRTLRNTPDVTARLLTAGSGTAASPAEVLRIIQEKLGECTSKAASAENSIVKLKAKSEELRQAIREVSDQTERVKDQNKELHEIENQRGNMQEHQQTLNEEIERLRAAQAELRQIDEQIAEIKKILSDICEQETQLKHEEDQYQLQVNHDLAEISEQDEMRIRESLETLGAERARREHAVDVARENFLSSSSIYQAFIEQEASGLNQRQQSRQRTTQLIVSIALPIVLLIAGIPAFVAGRMNHSLSVSLVGVGLVICGVIMAVAAFVLLFRPSPRDSIREEKRQSLQWVMLQDEKKFDSCQNELLECKQSIAAYLASVGLEAAQGSLRQAQKMLDEAQRIRGDMNRFSQRRQALLSQRRADEVRLQSLQNSRDIIIKDLIQRFAKEGSPLCTPVTQESLGQILAVRLEQRERLQEELESLNHRAGELKNILKEAEREQRFETLKLENAQVTTRLHEACDAYARLLLAQSMLESAVMVWEGRSQPEVYAHASRLLNEMTGGAWVEVRMNEQAALRVIDRFQEERNPSQLSYATCQQLYLALRIALLMTADNVGRALPILADDILVHFDDERSVQAAKALVELSTHRQVILFTCHQSLVELMQTVDPDLNLVRL